VRLLGQLSLAVAVSVSVSAPGAALAREPALVGPSEGPEGRPHVVLDRLEVPDSVPERRRVSQVLTKVLNHEQHRVEWGAGRNSRIEYRFHLEELELTVERGVLKVRCTALGRLPNGKTARSKLVFGGDAKAPRQVVDQVLAIVARGVLTRLADLERDRRTRR
jgi:hypothetical protein